jgi:4-alpha-glucanotransferase
VKHGTVHFLKLQILLGAWEAFRNLGNDDGKAELAHFEESNASWRPNFTLFRLLVQEYDGNPNWTEWRPEHHTPADAEQWLAAHPIRPGLEALRHALAFIQWVGWRQWTAVRAYAEHKSVRLMGEMSFGVSRSSVDAWAHPEIFDREWSAA